MSKLLSVVIPHRLGTPQAIQRISAGIPQFQPTFGKAVKLEQTSWAGNTLTYTVRAMGMRSAGTIVVMDDSVKLEANIPSLFVPFAGRIEALIKKHGAELLAGPAPEAAKPKRELEREEITVMAKVAARAAGRNWSELSKDERTSFRRKAREQRKARAEEKPAGGNAGRDRPPSP